MVLCVRKFGVLRSHAAPSKITFRSNFVTACSLVVSVLIFGFLVPAQEQSPPAEVLLPLVAVDHRGQPVSDLRPESLVVWDGKTQVSSGVKLIPGTSLPLRLGILIDTSNSQRDNDLYKAGVTSMKDFVNQIIRLDEDRVFFERFSTTAEATPLLSKQQLSGISFPLQVGGATVLYDAIALACSDRIGKPDSRTPMRRVLIILSDGEDNQSHITRAKAEAFPVSSGVLVFAISTNNSGRELKGDAVLNHFAKASGVLLTLVYVSKIWPRSLAKFGNRSNPCTTLLLCLRPHRATATSIRWMFTLPKASRWNSECQSSTHGIHSLVRDLIASRA